MTQLLVLNKEAVELCESEYLRMTGLNEESLIELIGFACAKEILNHYGPVDSDHIVVYAGPEKNGRYGIATALFLAPHAKKISICMPSISFENHFTSIKCNKDYYPTLEFTDMPVLGDIYIDALFGIELTKKPDSISEQFIEILNQQSNPVISIDLPSGTDANSFLIANEAVIPDLTLALWCLKPIHNHIKAKEICGEIACLDIGLPPRFVEKYAENQKIAC